ncbi:MAG: acyl-CoA dehydratase activase [Fibrobacterota bacterium]
MKTIGINTGSSSVKVVVVENGIIKQALHKAHEGNVRNTLLGIMNSIEGKDSMKAAVTGPVGRKQVQLPDIIEPVAVENALARKEIDVDAVVSVGGEDLAVYTVNNHRKVINTFAGNKCASGTGEFFKQQLLRMDMTLSDISSCRAGKAKKMSSRCSVFMKSDCTHKLNKGEATKEDIVMSLSHLMAGKVSEFLVKARIKKGKVLVTGGVASNLFVVERLKELMPEVEFDVPQEAAYFEAFGAAVYAERNGADVPEGSEIFDREKVSYECFRPMSSYEDRVEYVQAPLGKIKDGSGYILGIDGGSTTTKAVLVNMETKEICSSHYGRTHGNPIEALRKCLMEISEDVQKAGAEIKIPLVSVTGSSRELLSVYCETSGVYNEIIAHAAGTNFYSSDVDTIFEIGGQDAKYVLLKNGVPVDYAMNEACSAGTGSFLEESASGDLDIKDAKEIGPVAMNAQAPLKFGEHCSAFINSDIRKAIQEGAMREDITAGIVFSIVSNYLNRVVGNRRIGKKAVIQGGVAKNPAVPVAFAALMERPIMVPPLPELMGAFGVALLARQKHKEGRLERGSFTLEGLIKNKVEYGREFVCKSCNNLCPVSTIIINGNKYMFGGRCNKYANMRRKTSVDPGKVKDLVKVRSELIFGKYSADFSDLPEDSPSVAVPKVFSVYNLWPLYSVFFRELGVHARLIEEVNPAGIERCESDFCFPAELAHGIMQNAVDSGCDYLFLPQFKRMQSYEESVHATFCPVIQGIPYYLRKAFDLDEKSILKPIIDFDDGILKGKGAFIEMARKLGFSAESAGRAYLSAVKNLQDYTSETMKIGAAFLENAEKEDRTVIALMGRPYNVLTDIANMGVPRKFVTRGYSVIPFDFIPCADEKIATNMYWYYGQQNLKAASLIREKKNIFLAYVSNFSCAPDSFILHLIRWAMGVKPYLVLELDSHSADAGIDTRIEAFLDIVEGFRKTVGTSKSLERRPRYEMKFNLDDSHLVDNSTGKRIELNDEKVTFVWPSMGRLSSEAVSSFCVREGVRSITLPAPDGHTTQLARDVASGKECIPTLLVLGSIIKFLSSLPERDERIWLVCVPYTTGPCRTGQYANFFAQTFIDMGIENIALLTLNSDNSYTELGPSFSKNSWRALVIADAFKDIETGLRVLSEDREKALLKFNEIWEEFKDVVERKGSDIYAFLRKAAEEFKSIKKAKTLDDVRKIMTVGEIYVRRDDFSISELLDNLAEKGIYGKVAGVTEWFHYTDYVRENKIKSSIAKKPLLKRPFAKETKELMYLKTLEFPFKNSIEKKVMSILRPTGLIPDYPHDMKKIMSRVNEFTHMNYTTETSVSLCVAAEAMESGYSGIVSIAPFACLPGRLIKSIFNPYARERGYPFISLENDGLKYPSSLLNRLELFMLNVLRYENGV